MSGELVQRLELVWAEGSDPEAIDRIVEGATNGMLANFLMYGLVGINIQPPERKEEPSQGI